MIENQTNNSNSESLTINNDDDLLENAKLFSWQGSGSKNDPIIISDIFFTSPIDQHFQLEISNTRLNVRIENNTFVELYERNFTNQFRILNLYNVQNVKIINNIFVSKSDYTHGIESTLSQNIEISNNIFSDFEYGIICGYCSGFKISNNSILNNSWGIQFQHSNNTFVKKNYLLNNVGAIFLSQSSINISENLIENNINAIETFRGIGTLITNNYIQNNRHGIRLYVNSIMGLQICEQHYEPECNDTRSYITPETIQLHQSNVTIIKNNFINQSDYAISIDNYVDFNVVYNNNFINNSVDNSVSHGLTPSTNSIQIREEINQTTYNLWNNNTQGNYWSEYNGPDLDNNLIGDIPMSLEVNNTDYYPSIIPFIIQSVNVTKLSIPLNFWKNLENQKSIFQFISNSIQNLLPLIFLIIIIPLLLSFVYSYNSFTHSKRKLSKLKEKNFNYFTFLKSRIKRFFSIMKARKYKKDQPKLDIKTLKKLEEIINENN